MVRYLSNEWLAALDRAAASNDRPAAAANGLQVTVQHVVTCGEAPEVSYHVVISEGRVSFRPGTAERPNVTIRVDRATAVAIATGARSAQAAFLDASLVLDGDLRCLISCGEVLAGIDRALAKIRSDTEF